MKMIAGRLAANPRGRYASSWTGSPDTVSYVRSRRIVAFDPFGVDSINHGVAVGSVWKKCSSNPATFCLPDSEGCVPSVSTSLHVHVRPSLRLRVPSVHRYGPHPSHGRVSVAWI